MEKCNILDVASLLAHSVGVDIPAEYEGKFPVALYEEDYLSNHPPRVRWEGSLRDTKELASELEADSSVAAEGAMDAEDELMLTQRLRSLGYIE